MNGNLHNSDSKKIKKLEDKIKQLEKIIKQQRQELKQYDNFLEFTPIGVIITDSNGTIQKLNKKICEYFGYKENELLGKPVEMLVPIEIKKKHTNLRQGFVRNPEQRSMGYGRNLTGLRKDGTVFPIEVALSPVKIDDNLFVVAMITDITRRIELENKLKLSEENLKSAQQITKLGSWELDLKTNTLYWSDEIYRIFEINPNEFEASYEGFLNAIHPEDRELVNNAYTDSVKNHKPYKITHRLLMPDGRIKWVEENGITFYNDEGNPVKSIGAVQDITESYLLKKALEDSEKKLRELNQTKDKFFLIIAHDLRNPLGAFRDITKLLVDDSSTMAEKDKEEFIQIMNKTAEQVYELLENLLQWSRSQSGKIEFNPEKFEICSLITQNIQLARMQAEKKNITLACNTTNPMYCYADPNMITTVLRNLISNAIKFTPEGGRIEIDAVEEDDFIKVWVKDNGVGIPEKNLNKMFKIDEHVSTKGTSDEEGSGLGLILCKEFVEKNGGNIWVESEVGKGTTFYFTIPMATE